MIITIIPPQYIHLHLERVRELVERVRYLLEPRALPQDIIADCIDGSLTLWGVFNTLDDHELKAVAITNVRPYWRCKVLEIIILSGDNMKSWLDDLNETLVQFAIDSGCSIREIHGRKGWIRALERFGFKESGLVFLEHIIGQEERPQQQRDSKVRGDADDATVLREALCDEGDEQSGSAC